MMQPRDFAASDSIVLEAMVAPAGRRTTPAAARCRQRLLLVHNNEPRLLALIAALAETGYHVAPAADTEAARIALEQAAAPDVLVLEPGRGQAMLGIHFARTCLARWPVLRVLYLAPLPWPATLSLLGRERSLPVPFTEPTLAAALATA